MILLVVGGYAPSLLKFRGPLLKSCIATGHQVIACAPIADIDLKARLAQMGVIYEDIPLQRTGMNPVSDFATLRALVRLIRRHRPDQILAYTAKALLYTSLASRWVGGPATHSMVTGLGYSFGHGSRKQRFVGAMTRSLYRLALKRNAGVFFQNPDDCMMFRDMGLLPSGLPVTMINGSGVDLDWYVPKPLPDQPVFLLVARLLADKGIREYVEAARRVKRAFPQARFQLAGGFDSNPMAIKPDELNVWEKEGSIEYLGPLADVRPALAGARFYVLPSYGEGTPRTVLEAMATGRPVITTDAPGCRETVVDGDNGLLVPVRSVEALQQAMEILLEHSELVEHMAQRGLERVREKYDVHKVNAVIMEAMGL